MTRRHNPHETSARGAFDYLLDPKCTQSEPRAPVVRMPWWVTAIKVSIAGALLVWAFFG